MIIHYETAKEKLLTNLDEDCRQFFRKNGYILESGYSELLSDNLEEAKIYFLSIKDKNIRAHWALYMISLIEGNVKEYPSYLELRNFLEIDLNILIKNYKGDYVEKIIRYADYLFNINPEVYKFIGRVLYNNDLKDAAIAFLKRAREYFYNDPELHYQLAYIYYNDGNYNKSKSALNDCLRILPEYFPAKKLAEILKLA